jgi:hypothetical protein
VASSGTAEFQDDLSRAGMGLICLDQLGLLMPRG